MKNYEFKKGDLVRVNTSYVDYINSFQIDRRMRTLCGDIGIVLGTSFCKEQWPRQVSVYWAGFQRKVKMRTVYLGPINEEL